MKFNKEQCKSAALRRNSLRRQHTLGATQLQSSSAEGDLGVLVDTRSNRSHQYTSATKRAKGAFGCIGRSGDFRSKEVILPLSSELKRPHLLSWAPQYARDVDILGRVQGRATQMVKE